MANKPPSIPAGDGSPKRISRWKSVIDMLLGNRAIFQNRTGRTPSLDNIRDNHELRGLLRSDPNQAPYLSRMPNRAQDDHRRASGTIPSAAAQPGAQQPRWGGPGGKKMTPRVLAAYEVTQRHLQQPFHPIDLFREMWGDNHAEPAFWSGVPRESHIKYYAEYHANTGRKISQHAHTRSMSGRPQNMNEEGEEPDSDERNDAELPSTQEKANFQKQPTGDFKCHDKSNHSRNRQERTHTPGTYRGASAMNIYSPHVLENKLFGHNEPMDAFVGGVKENFLPADRAQRRATQLSRQASSIIRNYRGVSSNLSDSGRVSGDFLDELKIPPHLPEGEPETNSWSVTNGVLTEFERSPGLLGSEQQSLKQQQRREEETIIGDLNQQTSLGHEPAEQQSSRQQRRPEAETVIDVIIQEIPLAHQLAGEKRRRDHKSLRSASEGSVVLFGCANPGRKMSVATTVDSDGGQHRHSISGELLRTTSKPAHEKHKITTESRVSELPLHGLPGPTFTPSSHIIEYQGSEARNATIGRIVLNDFQRIPSITRRSSSYRQAGGLIASGSRAFGPRVVSFPFIQEDYSNAISSDDEGAAEASSMSMTRPSAAHGSMQTQSNCFHPSSERCEGSNRQPSGAFSSQRLVSPSYEYHFDPSTVVSLWSQRTGKKDLSSKRSRNRLHSIEAMSRRSPRLPTRAWQVREFSNQGPYAGTRPYTQLLQKSVGPCSSSGTPPSTKSMKDAVKAYDPPSTPSKMFSGGTQVGGLSRGASLAQSNRRQDCKKFKGNLLPFDPHDNQSVEDFMIESITPVAERTQLVNQAIISLRSVGSTFSTVSGKDALNFFLDDLFPPGKDPLKYENLEVSSSNDVNHRPRRKSLLSMEVVSDDETLQPSVNGSMEETRQLTRAHSSMTSMGDQLSIKVVPDDETLQRSVDGSMEDVGEPAPQLTCAHSTMTSMGDQTIRAADTFVFTGLPFENASTTFTETSVNDVVEEEIRRTPRTRNCLSTPLSQSLFPDEIEGKDLMEVIQMMNEVDKRHSEPFVPKTKSAVVKMTRTSLSSRVASEAFGAISTTARSEVEDDLPDFAQRPLVKQVKADEETPQQLEKRSNFAPYVVMKQENANEETPQQLEKRKSARRRLMRSCFGCDGAGDERPEYEPKGEAGKTLPGKHDYSGSGLLDGRLGWPTCDVEKASGFDVSPLADNGVRPPSSAVTQARERRAPPKQEIDGNLIQAIKDVLGELPPTGIRTAEVSMKGTEVSSHPFVQSLEHDLSPSQQSSRRPSSQAKMIAEELVAQYEAKLYPESQLRPQSSETTRLAQMNSFWKLSIMKDKKGFPALPAVRQKTWPPQPTVEDEEKPPQGILLEKPLLSKHVMVDVAQAGPSLRTDEELTIPKEVCKVFSATGQPDPSLRTAEEPIIPEEVSKLSSAVEHAGASLCTGEKSAIPKEERKVSFAIPPDNVSHQESKVATDDEQTTAKVVREVSSAPEHAGPSPRTGEKSTILKPIRKISATIDCGLANDQMPVVVRSSDIDAEITTEWSLVKWPMSTHRKIEESVRVGQNVPLNVVPELYRKTDVAAHGPGYMEARKDRTTGKGDFDGYMAVLPSYLQDQDFPLVAMPPEGAKEEKIVPPATRRHAVRSVPDLLTHIGETFRHLFDGELSMTTDPANFPLPGSSDGESCNWDDEEADGCDESKQASFNWKDEKVDCFDPFEEGFVKLFEKEPSDTTAPGNVLLIESPDTSSSNWNEEEADSDESEVLELLDLPPEPAPKMDMKLKRHFPSSWRPFPHKVVEPNLVSVPTHIRFCIYQMLLPFSHQHPVLLSPVATTLKFWPERSFRNSSDIFDKIGAMTLVNRQFHDEIMAFYLSQLRFHITLNCRISESLAPRMWKWLPLFAKQMQYLTVEIDFTKGSGNYKDGCALRLDGEAELEKLLRKVIVPLSKRDTPMRGLTIMARRFEGNRPSGQLVPFKTTTSAYQGNEKIGGKGLGKVEQPDEDNWSMIGGLTALPGFGEGDEELFYSLPHQKQKKENRWKNWFDFKSKPAKRTIPTNPRDKIGKNVLAHRFAQSRRPSGFKVTALRLLTGKSPMPDPSERLFAEPKPECPPMSPKRPPKPPRQKWYAHFSPSSSDGSRRFSGLGTPRTSQTPQMSPSPVQTPPADQRVFVPTSEAFKDPLPLFGGRRGSAMMGNWASKVETALCASVAAIEAREKALEAHTEYGYDEEQDKRQKRIARIKKMSYELDMARRMNCEPRRWFMSNKAARRKRVAMRRTKDTSFRRSSRHGRHRKALRRRHENINMDRKVKSLRRTTMPKYKYRVFHAMEQLHRGSIPNTVTIFKKKGFFRTRKGKRHAAFLKRRSQTPRAGMLLSSPYVPHDPVDNTLETLVACFGPPNGPGFFFLRLSGFTRERSEEICMQLVCKAMPVPLKGGGRKLWPKEAVGTFGKRRAGARFAQFEVFEEANSIPERRGRVIKIEDKEEEKKQSDDRKKDLAKEEPQPDDEKGLAEVLGALVDAQAERAKDYDAQRATMKKKVEVEHKHARQEFEFKTGYGERKKRMSKAMKAKEAGDSREDTTYVSGFLKKHLNKARSQVGGRRNWRAMGMEEDDYDDYEMFR